MTDKIVPEFYDWGPEGFYGPYRHGCDRFNLWHELMLRSLQEGVKDSINRQLIEKYGPKAPRVVFEDRIFDTWTLWRD